MTATVSGADSRRRQEAIEQARRREANESTEDSMQKTGRCPPDMFFCECSDPRCDRTVRVTIQEYESVRERPNHFLIVLNHENPEVECVISETERFAVVETLAGEASKVALRTDPRSLYMPERN
jgi:hypothetical protein